MLLGVVLATFILGHGWARASGASHVIACATGLGWVLAHAAILVAIGSVCAVVVSRHRLRQDFFDALCGFLASSIVVEWLLFALGGIIALAWDAFRAIVG